MNLKTGVQTTHLKQSRTMTPASSEKDQLNESLCIWLNTVDIGKKSHLSEEKDNKSPNEATQSCESKKIDLKKIMNL